jgi:hypothetical protein
MAQSDHRIVRVCLVYIVPVGALGLWGPAWREECRVRVSFVGLTHESPATQLLRLQEACRLGYQGAKSIAEELRRRGCDAERGYGSCGESTPM